MRLKTISFSLVAVMILVLITATLIEKFRGTPFVHDAVYGSAWFAALWALVAVCGSMLVFRRRLWKRPAVFLLHISLLLILAGALTTRLFGVQGSLHLRQNEPQTAFETQDDNSAMQLPFSVELLQFRVDCYPGTQSPMDYVSTIAVRRTNASTDTLRVSMNKIASVDGYRFYQSGYDDDLSGSRLTVSHDPWGIGITYAAYGLLFVSMLLVLVLPGETFRRLLRSKGAKAAAMLMLPLVAPSPTFASNATPKTLPADVAQKMGELYLYYNGRICPLQTAARDFTTKLCGRDTYRGLTAEQVLCGWMFYPTDWAAEPLIKIKGRAKQLVGTGRSRVSYRDFHSSSGYKLEQSLAAIRAGQPTDGARAIMEADEKMNLLLVLFKGRLLRLFPYRSGDALTWYASGDALPEDMPEGQYTFIRKSFDYAGELAWMNRTDDLSALIGKLKQYQRKEAAGLLPTDRLFNAERLYNRADHSRPLAMWLTALGVLSFFVCLGFIIRRKALPRWFSVLLRIITAAAFLYLLFLIALRGYVSGHLPLANGSETMQFMALCALGLSLVIGLRKPSSADQRTSSDARRSGFTASFGLLTGGLSLLVAGFGAGNPQITPLMPVLASPLLSVHVCIIMLAYALLAFTFFNAVAALIVWMAGHGKVQSDGESSGNDGRLLSELTRMSLLLLYPATFCLAAGIFIGAVWANQSWGRYWGWDPKEVWALITLLVYSFPIHRASLRSLQRPLPFHVFMLLAFAAVIITYFGVNFFLGGMHSYA